MTLNIKNLRIGYTIGKKNKDEDKETMYFHDSRSKSVMNLQKFRGKIKAEGIRLIRFL